MCVRPVEDGARFDLMIASPTSQPIVVIAVMAVPSAIVDVIDDFCEQS